MIFAREVSDSLTSLVKKIDAATVKNKDCKMGSFVVFLNDDENFDKKLKDLAGKEELKKIALAIDNPAGPADAWPSSPPPIVWKPLIQPRVGQGDSIITSR